MRSDREQTNVYMDPALRAQMRKGERSATVNTALRAYLAPDSIKSRTPLLNTPDAIKRSLLESISVLPEEHRPLLWSKVYASGLHMIRLLRDEEISEELARKVTSGVGLEVAGFSPEMDSDQLRAIWSGMINGYKCPDPQAEVQAGLDNIGQIREQSLTAAWELYGVSPGDAFYVRTRFIPIQEIILFQYGRDHTRARLFSGGQTTDDLVELTDVDTSTPRGKSAVDNLYTTFRYKIAMGGGLVPFTQVVRS